MATFKVVILPHHKKEDGTFNVKIRVTHDRKSRYIKTPYYIGGADISRRKRNGKEEIKIKNQAVIDALDNGNFYASEGPEITELYLEGGKVHLKCSGAAQISYTSGRRKSGIVRAKDGVPVTEASFPVVPEDVYFRLTVTDQNGMHATTNAYFTDEVLI